MNLNELFIRHGGRNLGRFLNYKELVEISSKLNLPLAPPLTASVQVTLRCNSKCSYCNMWKFKKNKSMPLDTLEEIFGSFRDLGVKIVSLTGGEPLTRNDLSEVIHLARHYGMQSHLCTNGISLTRERAIELAEAGIFGIVLSLDTLNPEIYERHRGIPFKFAEQALESLCYVVNEYPRIHGAVTCVITRHNIKDLVSFAESISEYGQGKILINLQPYHPPMSFSEISKGLSQEDAVELSKCYEDQLPSNFAPEPELKPIFERDIEELVSLKEKGYPINNSELYLRSIPDFLFNNKTPLNLNCLAGYTGIIVRHDLKVVPCWRLSPVGDLRKEKMTDIWFSEKYKKKRSDMRNLKCQRCLLLCHNEPGWFDLYKSIYKSSMKKCDEAK